MDTRVRYVKMIMICFLLQGYVLIESAQAEETSFDQETKRGLFGLSEEDVRKMDELKIMLAVAQLNIQKLIDNVKSLHEKNALLEQKNTSLHATIKTLQQDLVTLHHKKRFSLLGCCWPFSRATASLRSQSDLEAEQIQMSVLQRAVRFVDSESDTSDCIQRISNRPIAIDGEDVTILSSRVNQVIEMNRVRMLLTMSARFQKKSIHRSQITEV